MSNWSGVELARILADAAKTLASGDSLGATVEDIVGLAVSVVPGAESAGLTLVRNGKVDTPAATDDLVMACDNAQYETGEGPCLQAVWEDRILQVDDMAAERRWPKFAERAAALGVGSMLACHLSSERGSLSALNLYARATNAFDAQSRGVALVYATHATIALESSRLEGDLRAAVRTRQGIGQAVGIVMERHQLSAKQAFDLLVRASQTLNLKLRELADVVVSTGVDPSDTSELARAVVHGSAGRPGEMPAQPASAAARRADEASARDGSPHLIAEARLAAADAHEHAAREHQRQAAEHLRAAAAARAAAESQLDALP